MCRKEKGIEKEKSEAEKWRKQEKKTEDNKR